MGENSTRKNKFEKRRKNTKSISVLLVVGVILLLILIGMWLFGGNDDESTDEVEQGQVDNNDNQLIEEREEETDTDENELNEEGSVEDSESGTTEDSENLDDENVNNEEVVTEEVEPSDDNVAEAYTGNWQPVGTEQEGPHTVKYDNDSQDRLEMRKAIQLATGLNDSNYREWWVANGGDQKVVATVSDAEETEVYRVYLSWIDNEGWQPTKVEILIENDWEKY
ncbi:YrrS family protein [Oceanobacillus bengalensis]|uniref:DUF1510 family protein n=1 Tax=Oceanobacillus bengalensis TaxID=1435466 RepID=A0A494Z5S7_9BACI|nr:YrrS family protein [Oceanobacillus bengalensis]RKQ17890.1 DUF1510 family protein [Oceanobacillus bengalensis]